MAAGPTGRSRLVKIVAFQPGYPYYGNIQTHLNGPVSGGKDSLIHQSPQVWIYPELRGLLEVDLGDELKIGESAFRVLDLVEDESGLSFQAAELAPKVFISEHFLERTKLLQRGNTAFRNYLLKLPSPLPKCKPFLTKRSDTGPVACFITSPISWALSPWSLFSSPSWEAVTSTTVSLTNVLRKWPFCPASGPPREPL